MHPWRLEYLYVGSSDFERDLAFWRDVIGGEVVWSFEAFGAKVAALDLGKRPPLWLLADHRAAPSVLPVFAVDDLEAAERDLRGRGWEPPSDRFEIPDGPCYVFRDPSGNECAIYGNVRPHALERQ